MMFVARMVCSDEACAQDRVAELTSLDELDALACECGCTFQVLGWPDWVEDEPAGAEVVALPVRRREREQRLAS